MPIGPAPTGALREELPAASKVPLNGGVGVVSWAISSGKGRLALEEGLGRERGGEDEEGDDDGRTHGIQSPAG
jgi:hypothetical protein